QGRSSPSRRIHSAARRDGGTFRFPHLLVWSVVGKVAKGERLVRQRGVGGAYPKPGSGSGGGADYGLYVMLDGAGAQAYRAEHYVRWLGERYVENHGYKTPGRRVVSGVYRNRAVGVAAVYGGRATVPKHAEADGAVRKGPGERQVFRNLYLRVAVHYKR